jgi:hypothetical protein
MSSKAEIIKRICELLLRSDTDAARAVATTEYPFVSVENGSRKYTEYRVTSLFIRDGFLDRYSGAKLVFPGSLRLLSRLMPDEFPAHKNWKMTASHIVYWELFPTVDHILPVARGGADDESNWATTSMLRNSAKSNWTLDELGWTLLPPGDYAVWDGLLGWFISYVAQDKSHVCDKYVRRWHKAALRATSG